MEKKVKELKEELAYNERKWGEESESFKKQFLEENQQKIHVNNMIFYFILFSLAFID